MLELTRAAAAGRTDLRLRDFSRADIARAVDNGLGPWLCHATAGDPERETVAGWSQVKSSDLTSRVLSGEQVDAMVEILDACPRPELVTLLKGIAIGQSFYPAAHLRLMRDLDVLVPKGEVPRLDRALSQLGYVRKAAPHGLPPAHHHHGQAFWHPETENWVEVHWGLVPPVGGLASEPAFREETLAAEVRPRSLRGRPARVLTTELQIVHVASHWARDIPLIGGAIGLIDLSLLLGSREPIDWPRVLGWLEEGPETAANLYLCLTFLEKRGLVAGLGEVIREIGRQQRGLNRASLALLHHTIDRYVVGAAPLSRPVTEPVFRTLWDDLLRPEPAWWNILRLGRYLVPRRRRRPSRAARP